MTQHYIHEKVVLSADEYQVAGSHYKEMGIAPWDVVDTWSTEQQVGAHRKDVLKYLMRMYDKNTPLENAQKAAHCLQKLIEVLTDADHSEKESYSPEGA